MVRRSLLVLLSACASPAAPPPAAPAPLPAAPPTPPPAVAKDPEAIAREVVAKLAAHDYAAVTARFDDKMLAALPAKTLETKWNELAAGVGAFDRIEAATTTDDA